MSDQQAVINKEAQKQMQQAFEAYKKDKNSV